MSQNKPTIDTFKHSDPIPISASPLRGARARSGSMSSISSSSASSLSDIPTPLSGSGSASRVTIPSPGSSPILSYFLAQSPNKSPTFPFRNFTAPPIQEEDGKAELPAAMHARRATTVAAGRFAQPQHTPLPEPHLERGTGLLRRLSLSTTTFTRPQSDAVGSPQSSPSAPPNSAVSPVAKNVPYSRDTKPRRSATISIDGSKPRRAPSPMGERMLKGHFDGFN